MPPPEHAITDVKLIRLIRSDPNEGLAILAATRIRSVLAHLRSSGRCRNEQRLDEIGSELLIHVWRNAHAFDPEKGSIYAWLTGIALNILRWQKPAHRQLPEQEARSITHPARGASVGTTLMRDAVRDALHELPDRQQVLAEMDLASASGSADTKAAMEAIGAASPDAVYGVRKRYLRRLADPERHRRLHSVMRRLRSSRL